MFYAAGWNQFEGKKRQTNVMNALPQELFGGKLHLIIWEFRKSGNSIYSAYTMPNK